MTQPHPEEAGQPAGPVAIPQRETARSPSTVGFDSTVEPVPGAQGGEASPDSTAKPNCDAHQATLTLDPQRAFAPPAAPVATPMPLKVGRFEIRRVLGEGGFGIVYEAHDPQLDRAIALKVAKLGGDSEQRIKRFLREAKSAANLRHPHIVPLFEFGQDGEQFYLALAYIPGQSLDHVIRALNAKKKKMDCRRAAILVRHLAEALAYAHGLGIVHRDIKPHNVMLDERGAPLLMDFGLAAREMDEKLTREGAIMGTAAYLAPEQYRGEPTAASDQYSLGVTLYELLTGETPFTGPPDVQIYNHLHTEPASPRKRNREVTRDLETICLKCLEKDAAKRYADCRALADDLRRWLDGEPITARPIGVIERTWRWSRRNRGLAAALAAIVLVLIGATVVSVTAALTINAARNEEIKAKRDAIEQRQNSDRHAKRASAGLKLASAALDAAVNKITENPRLRDQGFHAMRKELLSSVLPYYEELAKLESDDPDLEAERARAYGKLGTIRHWMGENELAVAAYRKMGAVFDRLIEKHPDVPAYLYAAAESHNALGMLVNEEGTKEPAADGLQRAEDLADRLLQVAPGEAKHHSLRLILYLNRAKHLLRKVKYEPVLDTLRMAEQFQTEAAKRFPADVDLQVYLADLHTTRGFCYGQMKNRADSEASYRAALAVIRPIAAAPGASQAQRHQLGTTLINLGAQMERPQDAHDRFEEARQLYLRLVAESPDVPYYRQWLSGTYHNLASAYNGLGQHKKATEFRRESLKIFENLVAEFPELLGFQGSLAMSYFNLGGKEIEQGNLALALDWLTKAATIVESLRRHDPENLGLKQQLADSYRGTASCLGQLNRYVESIAACDRALALDGGAHRADLRSARSWNIVLIRQESVPALRLARKGEHVKAVAAIDALVKGPNAHVEMDFNAACVYALCAAHVKDKEPKLGEGYAVRAVALLVNAKAAGFFKDAEMLKLLREDADFTSLRGRADFKKLEAELTGGSR